MLMPSGVDSPLPSVSSAMATTMVTPTSASMVPAVTTTIQPIQQRDTTWTKLFVGGLPYHTSDKSLREHFEVYGDIEEAVVITDRSTGKSRGYGFVIMSNKEAAERACKEPNPIIDGRKANVNLAILGAKPRGNITSAQPLLTALRPGFNSILPTGGQFGQPMGQQASPYLQQLYAAAATQQAYGLSPNIMQLMGAGNPLLDMSSLYGGYSPQAQMIPVTQHQQMTAGDLGQQQQQQQQQMLSGQSQAYAQAALQYAYASPGMLTAQQLSGLSGGGIPGYAAAAAPTQPTVAQGSGVQGEQRIQ